MTMAEMSERANNLRHTIIQQEALLSHLSNQQRAAAANGNPLDPTVAAKIRQSMLDVKGKKDYLQRMMNAMQNNMGMISGPSSQPGNNNNSGGPGPGPQQPPPWLSQQAGQSPPFDNPISIPNPSGNGSGSSQMRGGGMPNVPPSNVHPSPSHMHAQANHLIGGGVPPRSGPTPHQQGPGPGPHGTPGGPGNSGRPFPSQMSPNMGPQLPFTASSPPGMGVTGGGAGVPMNVNVGGPMQLPPPLEKARFENAYKSWVQARNMKHDERLMSVDGRLIDLYALHMNVMQEGGFNKVQNQELWVVIGGKMGFVQFPGTDAEPAKSGPGVAQRLAAVYKDYLLPFDTMYITSVIERRKQMQAAAAAVQAAALASGNAGGGGNGGPGVAGGPGPSHGPLNPNPNPNNNNPNMNPSSNPNNNPANGNPNPNTNPNSNPNNNNPNQGMGISANMNMPPNPRAIDARTMQQVIGFANKSVSELRQMGVSEQIIAFVETNRAHLQRTVMEQGIFRGGMRGEQGIGAGPGAGTMFVGSSVQGQGQGQQGQGQGGAGIPGGSRQPPPFIGQGKAMMQGGQGGGGGGFMGGQMMPQANGPIAPLARPSPQQLQQLLGFVEKTKVGFKQTRLPNMQPQDVPQEHHQEYATLLDQLHRFAQEIDAKLPMYMFVLKSEDMIKKLIAIILTVGQQKSMFAVGNMRYLMTLDMLRNMMAQVHHANDVFTSFLQNAMNGRSSQMQQQPQMMLGVPPPGHVTQEMTRPQMPPQPPSQMPPHGLHSSSRQPPPIPQQQPPPPGLRPAVPPQLVKKPSSSSQNTQPMSVSTPTPPPSHSTPVANAPTPSALSGSSPQAPRSPKKVRVNRRERRSSVKNTPAGVATAAVTTSNAPSNANTPAPPPPPSEPPTPASGSGSGSSTKRQRDEESSTPSLTSILGESPAASGSGAVANEPSPPKKPKMDEWDGSPSEALKKKTEAVENVKTEEDATAFLEQMTELIMAARGEGQESLTSDISETLDMILKGYADGTDATHRLPSLGMGNESDVAQPTPAIPPVDEFVEFFDFSSFGTLDDDDVGSKAPPTPDLLSSSSTNPSPESNASEADAAHHALLSATDTISTKMEDNGVSDLLRLGTLKEIDGGESAYFQPSDWKWDGSMPALEQPWAGFSS